MTQMTPDIGSWFEDVDSGEVFEVVAIDEFQQTIEVQYLDGTVGEIEPGDWISRSLAAAAAPEDANAAYGLTAREQDPDSDAPGPDFMSQLDSLEGESFAGTDESSF
ncbi:hypothetical protein Maes01_00029 [Microbulbifer aestuariivivens]|uniref:Uncharacterized protein n=1 Tax=Microbulbifer aestuariivivens TaxID=1908308 RepID=A0ABP9WK57_9GAMM